MCYNCGCQMPEDDMGKGKLSQGGGSLVEDDFDHMADVWNMPKKQAKKLVYEELKRQLGDEVKEDEE